MPVIGGGQNSGAGTRAQRILRAAVVFAAAWLRGASAARATVKFTVVVLAVLIPVSLLLVASAPKASSNTIIVNTTSDTPANGFCTLREAIANANAKSDTSGGHCAAGTGTDTINFSLSGTITLGSSLPAIANASPDSLTIDGTMQTITIDGADTYTVFFVESGTTLNLSDVTIAHGNAEEVSGGIENEGILSVVNCTLTDDSGALGGGIENDGTLVVTNSSFIEDIAGLGGGIYNDGSLVVMNCTFLDDLADDGAGIYNDNDGALNVNNTTFSGGNATGGDGSPGFGGGIDSQSFFEAIVTSSTFSNNAALRGRDVSAIDADVVIDNSILASGGPNTDGGPNCVVTVANGLQKKSQRS